jgi:hypothetical protein
MNATADELIARKQAGRDCTDEESAWIKRYFDTHHPADTAEGRALADAYLLESDEWFAEVERGERA